MAPLSGCGSARIRAGLWGDQPELKTILRQSGSLFILWQITQLELGEQGLAVGQFDKSYLPVPDTTEPLMESWNGSRWGHVAIPDVPAPPPNMYGEFDPLDPALFGVSCVARSGCTAVGAQAIGSDSVTLAESDMGTSGAAPPVSLTQTSTRSASAADGAGYRGQLAATNAIGPVTYSETVSVDSSEIGVSSTGAITAAATLVPGTYTVFGTDSDTAGDRGAWSFALAIDTASGLPPVGTPVFGHTATVRPVSGVVLIELAGTHAFVALGSASTVPLGAILDTTHGTVRLTAAAGAHASTEMGLFYSGVFSVTQTTARSGVRGGKLVPLTVLTLAGARPTGCGVAHAGRQASAEAAHARPKPKKRSLWGNAHGNFRTTGTYASATVRGTEWLTEDTCAGTLIRVARGVVSVDDFSHHRTILVRAPHSFLAHPGSGG